MIQTTEHLWLSRYALLTAFATLVLVCIGGLVTSHGAGMAVPDWPNTYGYNMFFFPFSKWVGGIFYEHTHRLLAAFVGLLTTVLAVWLWARETSGRTRWLGVGLFFIVVGLMGVREMAVYLALAGAAIGVAFISGWHIRHEPGALRWWGVIAFAAVILQGVLGGLRVVWLKDEIGIFHATLAQLFFALLCAIALFSTYWWQEKREQPLPQSGLRRACAGATLLILVQLVLGATMRHQHAGLAIPDFPTAYGKWWPDLDAAAIAQYNQDRVDVNAVNPIATVHIVLQMAHRLTAILILSTVFACAWSAVRRLGLRHPLSRISVAWSGVILVQICLGAATIWTGKSADIATGHVAVGAVSLATGVLAVSVATRMLASRRAEIAELVSPKLAPEMMVADVASATNGRCVT